MLLAALQVATPVVLSDSLVVGLLVDVRIVESSMCLPPFMPVLVLLYIGTFALR